MVEPAGVLPAQDIEALIAAGSVIGTPAITPSQIQPASLDLRLGRTAHRLRASFLPGSTASVRERLAELSLAELTLESPAIFERGCVYLVELLESCHLPPDIWATANPKSSTGRIDVFTRLITDYGEEFDAVRAGYTGRLYAEVFARTFSVLVKTGTPVSQIRFVIGDPVLTDQDLRHLNSREGLVYSDSDDPITARIDGGLRLSLSLQSADGGPVAYKAKRNCPLIDLGRIAHYEPQVFWDQIHAPSDGRLILDPGDFYILASRERIRVPPSVAAEMVPFDAAVGEFRTHYAGFFDPGWGCTEPLVRGTRAVLEVRAHEVPFLMEHGQGVCRLVYSYLANEPVRLYGPSIGSSYQGQGVRLGKQFAQ